MTCTLPRAARVHLQSTQNTKQLLFHKLQEVVVTKSPLFSHTQLGKHQLHQTRAVLFWKDMVCWVNEALVHCHLAPLCSVMKQQKHLWQKKGSARRHEPVRNSWQKHTFTLLYSGHLMTSLPLSTDLFTFKLCLFVYTWCVNKQPSPCCIFKRANLHLCACKTPAAVYERSASETQLVIFIASGCTSCQDSCVLQQQKHKKETLSVTTTATLTFSES